MVPRSRFFFFFFPFTYSLEWLSLSENQIDIFFNLLRVASSLSSHWGKVRHFSLLVDCTGSPTMARSASLGLELIQLWASKLNIEVRERSLPLYQALVMAFPTNHIRRINSFRLSFTIVTSIGGLPRRSLLTKRLARTRLCSLFTSFLDDACLRGLFSFPWEIFPT